MKQKKEEKGGSLASSRIPGLEGQTDGEATKKKGEADGRKRLPFSHQMRTRGVVGSER